MSRIYPDPYGVSGLRSQISDLRTQLDSTVAKQGDLIVSQAQLIALLDKHFADLEVFRRIVADLQDRVAALESGTDE